MNNLVPIFVVGFIVLGIYRLVELFARRKERMVILEKLGEQINFSEANVDLNLPLFQQSKSNWALKFSLLLIGIGIGLLVGYGFEFAATGGEVANYSGNWDFQRKIGVVYSASVAIFGGIGLLSAYFIEQKHKTKE
jgi:hypothetical protein